MSTLAFSARALARRNTIPSVSSSTQDEPSPSPVLYTETHDLHQRLLLDSLFSASHTRKIAGCLATSETTTQTSQAGSDDDSEAPLPRRRRRRRARTDDAAASSSRTTTIPTMAPHTWISLWFLLTAPVIAWDATYLFFRPRSMAGGDLHWIWKPYEIYQEIDWIYGVKAVEEGDGFPAAQAFLNVIETLLNLVYLYLAHVTPSPSAPLIGFCAATMTLWKTVLYWMQEAFCSGAGCTVRHNNLVDLTVYWLIPNGIWLVVPTAIIYVLGRDIAHSLWAAARLSEGGRAGGKKSATKVE
ncbi:hypothetical protein BD626DRAFT_183122 [Schizophyllum amplum]|uniref:Emopamil-binding protein n=1 Tax=Schizophyllum amplum TaxID=97359 RepID=A0A550C137_9AGAR|nr:hypothetical protein BD626DRAFT_183122 [Auriculariopsis ampla]